MEPTLILIGRVGVLLFGVWLVGVSLFALLRPRKAVEAIGMFASTNLINYSELVFRAAVGISFVWCASLSRLPEIATVVGWGLLVSAVILALIPRRWHASFAKYWSGRIPPAFVYVLAPTSLLVGVLLLYEFGVRSGI